LVETKIGKILVIGGGFGGIAAALRGRSLGYDVTLIERLDNLGGRAQVLEIDGFKHDAGPTVITAPFLFGELFELFGEDIKDYVTFIPLSPWYRYVFHNGQTFDYSGDINLLNTEIRKFSPTDVDNYQKLLQASKKIFEVGFSKLSHVPFLTISSMIRQIPNLIRLRADKTVSGFVKGYIKHPLLRQALSIHPLLVGGNPFSTTSIYSLIHYLEKKWGIHFCKGGTGKLVEELAKLMQRNKIEILTNTEVKKINYTNNKVQSVIINNDEELYFDHIICNADPPVVYKKLLGFPSNRSMGLKKWFPDRFVNYSMGLYVLFFGTKKQYPDVAHHTIWLTERFKELLKDIFDRGKLTKDFSLYIHRPTATDQSFAPHGCDSFYVLCPVPNLQTPIDWEVEGHILRDKIVQALAETILPDLDNQITAEYWMTPKTFKDKYLCAHGAGFSIAPNLTQSAWFRYHNQDPKLKNLYFVGAGTHPGAGLPGVVSSAKVVERLIKEQ
jgi:phytoene desaturase